MSDIKINNITDRSGSSGPIFAGISTVSTSAFMIMPSGPTEFRGGRGRGVFCGGETPSKVNTLDKIEIATTGNATDFGDLSELKSNPSASGNSVRGIVFGGENPNVSGKIDYFIFCTQPFSKFFFLSVSEF